MSLLFSFFSALIFIYLCLFAIAFFEALPFVALFTWAPSVVAYFLGKKLLSIEFTKTDAELTKKIRTIRYMIIAPLFIATLLLIRFTIPLIMLALQYLQGILMMLIRTPSLSSFWLSALIIIITIVFVFGIFLVLKEAKSLLSSKFQRTYIVGLSLYGAFNVLPWIFQQETFFFSVIFIAIGALLFFLLR